MTVTRRYAQNPSTDGSEAQQVALHRPKGYHQSACAEQTLIARGTPSGQILVHQVGNLLEVQCPVDGSHPSVRGTK